VLRGLTGTGGIETLRSDQNTGLWYDGLNIFGDGTNAELKQEGG
jgi:hypothetical protein